MVDKTTAYVAAMTTHSWIRFALTALLLAIALLLAHWLWEDYMHAPWTRDGRVRADVVQVAADVSGTVVEVHVQDNQVVKKGQLLYVIDPARFEDALAKAEADVAQAAAQRGLSLAQSAERASESSMKQAQARRRAALGELVISREAMADASAAADQARSSHTAARSGVHAAEAAYEAALAARQVAQRDLERSRVTAAVDGVVTNLTLRTGDYGQAGQSRMAIIASGSYWVYGYFEETRLPGIRIGDTADIRLMAGGRHLTGRVESIATGIEDRDNAGGDGQLHNVNPVFTWIRLAQRIPVRIALDPVPSDVMLVSGMTCTVTLTPAPAPSRGTETAGRMQ
ncbi:MULTISPECIES: HlyD family secretion protein [Stenotrophomonas]|uniref:HlyD family efflux transporter periplasmic adaptor subunit n=1 Tax=Stenotrophomonas TaxID=40323 RepID=UPI000B701975|nr:Multidrug resistance efflux pump [Stenotrophomonas sp. yr243]SNT66517.1 Multidrug resistance efflux pump [Stenotrophomonas lactitubi]